MTRENGGPSEFNPLDGFRYYPEANQPSLVSGCVSQDDPPAIPPQLGFINNQGTIIQVSWEQAARHGKIVLMTMPEPQTMESYAQLHRNNGLKPKDVQK